MQIAIGQKVKELRKKRGWTQGDLSERLGYDTKSAVGRIEAGLWNPGLDIVVKIAQVLGCSPLELLGWDHPDGIVGDIVSIVSALDESQQKQVLSYAKYIAQEGGADGV